MIDLHTHTTASDGVCSPTELVRLAGHLDLTALAVTDHDTVSGLDEAIQVAEEFRMTLVPGIELSAELPGGTLHVVGLYIDHHNVSFREELNRVLEMRTLRNPLIVERLQSLQIDITMADVLAEARGSEVVGRPHFARVMVRRGLVSDMRTAFEKYLGTGGAADVPKERLSPIEAIGLISLAGGLPVLAHPAQTRRAGRELEKLVAELVDAGLKGIETTCPGHDSGTRGEYERLARHFGLLRSGGSDFHDLARSTGRLGHGSGGAAIPDAIFRDICRYLNKSG